MIKNMVGSNGGFFARDECVASRVPPEASPESRHGAFGTAPGGLGAAVVAAPREADCELIEPKHVHDADLANNRKRVDERE